ncbi:inter-alpha-trypsin inhibitor heavy chain H3-like isoform X2 [Antennarius striatus]|uniref:inter-alpha-trypsin inhibitor heavy chain H3-like isoform X2 n=1 Tax=Antennarius striatus TaxID=241820 RepID=UPI0035B25A9A
MERAVMKITICCLLLALVASLPNKDDWDIYSFHINSTVTSRYAVTTITSRVVNRMDESKEIEFHVRIPKNAFISKFKMLIDGQEYDGVVKAKEQAQQQYTEAVSRGQSAGIVSSVGRTLEEFKTSVTIASHKKVTFELTYEELLKRKLGKYELQIHARPMQPVKDFKVDVYINERAGINFIEVQGGLSTKDLANAITKTHADKQASVSFYPTVDQQKTCDACGNDGLNGDLVIVYDVNRDSSLGHIKKSDGYFVHHFAPTGLPRIPKNVVFVIDQSGSMHGRKIQQTRTALIHILNDLAEDDYFGLISFDSQIFHWKRELVRATKANLEGAKVFARNIVDRGATDINAAVLQGAQMLNVHTREGSASILILLTDGDPTTGVTNLEKIQSNVKKAIAGKFPLHCLGFGFDVNFEFLEKMALQNHGMARRIYEDSDADLQLQGFYEEVATPLLTDVTMIYIGGTNVTQTNFSQYYNGSEIVVAGQITDNNIETFTPQVLAFSNNTEIVFSDTNEATESSGAVSDSHIQRVWAYLTVKQLLEKELQSSGVERENVKNEALRLSLKYSFVTPLTSMVVTKPLGETTDVLNKPKEGANPSQWQPPLQHSPPGQPGLQGIPGGYGMPGPPMALPGILFRMPTRGVGAVPHPGFGGSVGAGAVPHPGFGGSVVAGSAPDPGLGGRVGGRANSAKVLKTPNLKIIQSFDTADYDVPAFFPTFNVPVMITPPQIPLPHRFLLKTADQSPPLCLDISGIRKLLHHPNSELTVNGELDAVNNGGFRRFGIHLKNDHYIEVHPKEIITRQGHTVEIHSGQDLLTFGSATVIRRDKEIDITVGDTRLVILIHDEGGEKLLWPVLKQQPSDTNVTGVLALQPAVYEEVQQTPSAKLKINNQEIDVTRSNAVDYTVVPTVLLSCWLMPAESALQRSLNDFIVTEL